MAYLFVICPMPGNIVRFERDSNVDVCTVRHAQSRAIVQGKVCPDYTRTPTAATISERHEQSYKVKSVPTEENPAGATHTELHCPSVENRVGVTHTEQHCPHNQMHETRPHGNLVSRVGAA